MCFYMVRVVKRSRPRIVIPICVGSNPIMHPKLNSTACVKNSMTMGPTAGDQIDPAPLTGREPRGLLVTVEVMLLEGREHSLFIVFCTFKHNAVGC